MMESFGRRISRVFDLTGGGSSRVTHHEDIPLITVERPTATDDHITDDDDDDNDQLLQSHDTTTPRYLY